MHPEFKAYVEAVCETADQVQPSRVTRHSDRAVQPIAATKKNSSHSLQIYWTSFHLITAS